MSSTDINFELNRKPVGSGIDTAQLQRGSGIRSQFVEFKVRNDPNWFSRFEDNVLGIYAADPLILSNVADWTRPAGALAIQYPTSYQTELPFAITPCLQVNIANGANITMGSRMTFRLTGTDQYGNGIVEETPWLTFAAQAAIVAPNVSSTWIFWMAKTFSSVTKIEYKAEGIGAGDVATLKCGIFYQPNFNAAPPGGNVDILDSTALGDTAPYWNQGFGLLQECKQHRLNNPGTALAGAFISGDGSRDIISGEMENITQSATAVFGALDITTSSGGFLIGEIDGRLNWDPGLNKVGIFLATPTLSMREYPGTQTAVPGIGPNPALAFEPDWGDEFNIRLRIHSSVGIGNTDAQYPNPDLSL